MLSYSERSTQKYIDYMEDLKDKIQIQIKMLSYSQRSIQKYIDYMECVEPVFPIVKYVSVFRVFKNSNETLSVVPYLIVHQFKLRTLRTGF